MVVLSQTIGQRLNMTGPQRPRFMTHSEAPDHPPDGRHWAVFGPAVQRITEQLALSHRRVHHPEVLPQGPDGLVGDLGQPSVEAGATAQLTGQPVERNHQDPLVASRVTPAKRFLNQQHRNRPRHAKDQGEPADASRKPGYHTQHGRQHNQSPSTPMIRDYPDLKRADGGVAPKASKQRVTPRDPLSPPSGRGRCQQSDGPDHQHERRPGGHAAQPVRVWSSSAQADRDPGTATPRSTSGSSPSPVAQSAPGPSSNTSVT